MSKQSGLVPIDLKRCQSEKPNGCTFMTFGGVPGYARCKSKPTVIVTERKKNKEYGQRGSMTLCNECWAKATKQLGPGHFTVGPITKSQIE